LRFGRQTKAGLSLALGVLIGLGLVILPGVLAPSTQTSTASGSNSKATFSSAQSSSGSMSNLPTGASNTITFGSLLILVGLILLPAIALSYFARALTLKQAKARLRD
jgi:hypothetical protein